MGAQILVRTSGPSAAQILNQCRSGEPHRFTTIPGGTHALLNTLDDMRLYEVRTGRCVWTRASTPGSFVVDMAEGGKAARILLVPPNYSQDACITIQEVYLPTGESREILSVPLPQDTTMNMYWSGDLREDLFVLHAYICSIPGGGKQILLSYNTGPTIDVCSMVSGIDTADPRPS
ncbi:hypothetical protein C8J57DRAFT_1332218 [Mycena rebaudengoi]|nr:hypothetical protein C8J57DRAFT_1332218 [Mycena rebaudengoi]